MMAFILMGVTFAIYRIMSFHEKLEYPDDK